jgi:uncharacterized membrane protein
MKTRLLNIWGYISSSFWFIPVVMVMTAVMLSFVMIALDTQINLEQSRVYDLLYSGGPDGARAILSTIAASMITVAGVVFSITIVALTLASSQFGPRLLRNFMQSTSTQVVLGTFISTFIYCLLILRHVFAGDNGALTLNLSVSLAIAMALAGVIVLIYFIHHVSTSIQADHVIEVVYSELLDNLQSLFPERDNPGDEGNAQKPPVDEGLYERYPVKTQVFAGEDGYLQAIDRPGLKNTATDNDLLLEVHYRAGHSIIRGFTLVTVHSVKEMETDVLGRMSDAFIIGYRRTPEQDIECAVNQLVEVAVRALSPGINDPYTAIACIDRLGAALCHLANREFPSGCERDEDGNPRIISKAVTYSGVVNTAIDQVRQYGRDSVAVSIRLIEVLADVAACARTAEYRQAIARQAEMIMSASEAALPERNDIADVRNRYDRLLSVLTAH